MKGTVKFFNTSKGWGFITDTEGKDNFFYYLGIKIDGFKSLHEGDIVEFEIEQDTRGKEQAVNVTPIITRKIVAHELSKEKLHLMRIKDDKGTHGWYVADKEDNPVVDKEMSLLEVAAYVGIDTEELEAEL